MNILSYFILAISAVWSHKLRSGLTLISIAIGIAAIIGVTSLSESFNKALQTDLAQLGQNTFKIEKEPPNRARRRRGRSSSDLRPELTYSVARQFKEQMQEAQAVSIADEIRGFRIKWGNKATNPNVGLIGCDRAYFDCSNRDIEFGRPITEEDVSFNRPVAVIGPDVAQALFGELSPLSYEVLIGAQRFTVVGVLRSQGALQQQSPDNVVLIPIPIFMNKFANSKRNSVELFVKSFNLASLSATVDEAIGLMRVLRNLKPGEENDFEITTNESLTEQFSTLATYGVGFALVSAIIALVTAGIGIMNIMLVSIRERTREIGIRKAVGAKRGTILIQFVVESIALSQLGGAAGILLGVFGTQLLLFAVSDNTTLSVSIPLYWILFSLAFCTLIGIVFGSYPAWKAANLDPIEALRYE